MAVTEPYSSLFNAIKAALVHDDGPFSQDDQVLFWEDDGSEDLAPSEQLRQRLSRAIPTALISDSGSTFGGESGGGNEYDEEIAITIRYAVRVPTHTQAQQADGTQYWGEFPVRKWILNKLALHRLAVAGVAFELIPVSRRTINVAEVGLIARALEFRAGFIHAV